MAAASQYTDYVIQTNILKSLEVLEDKARKEWHDKWGFYLEFPKIILEEASKLGYSEEQYKKITRRGKKMEMNYLEDVIISAEATDAVPTTSSAFVGWRSDRKYSLEKFGPLYVSPKHTLPYEPPSYCIKLG
ncbi:uncharacterized protein [Diabrotica undecimpunctata]|uniref:uncharacterized protein n=1 Tax=Diabrotica undecimpunctata TaxID=50387 RepID=UPI003B63FF89